ncbi:radical SAM family heme chaperone HemW [Clostridium folliculivorans]|uniref:Heme chaperone HemW n=1 Tax=Clostridium folliculivorans TaxID=2886038 RepID=A0A9W5XZ58_9CLOT|nr:radical SAM family heme chaperone HemW [Clostridium folliculivorans]GKU23618.1 coproporphyrinogen III oxidase [Clostridium folliculivorans]GKU29734.1 coproporphyrinogen III oxidase [Clostridium folliculivorans]
MEKIALYVHIPFCKQKCFYCDFHSFQGMEEAMERYTKALIEEIKRKAQKYEITSVFIGGGTPTYLYLPLFEELLKCIGSLNLSKDIEYTVECNPGTLNDEILEVMKKNKVNRLSLGLQACQDNLLTVIGRIHNYKEFEENFYLARSKGFDNINVDLMYGLPGQKVDQWKESLSKIIKLSPEHISAYSLIVEEDTIFYRWYEQNKLNLPTEDQEREMNDLTHSLLKDSGYNRYEISNYAKEGKECKHNLVYWNLEDYIACGTGASAYIGGVRYKNLLNMNKYMEAIEKSLEEYEEVIKNSSEDNMEEFMFMGLRKLEGISEDNFKKRFKVSIDDIFKAVIDKHVKDRLLVRENGMIFLSEKGIELSNYVMSDFMLT